MRKVREIIRLSQYSELSQRQIAAASGASRPVVSQYLHWFHNSGLSPTEVEQLSDSELSQRLEFRQAQHDERYADFQTRVDTFIRELGNKHVTRRLLWEEYRRNVPDGYGYTQFCYYLQMHLESDSDLAMHLEHTPGQKLFLDYAGYRPRLLDVSTRTEVELALFVATFPAGGLIYCEARRSEALVETVEATQNALWFAGGVAATLVPDNLRSAVTKSDPYEPEINATFDDMATHYDCVVVPARSRRPKDKALVEKAVELVYKRVIAPLRHRTFSRIDDLNEAYWEKLDELNDEPMQRSGISRRSQFEQHERSELKPLPADRYVLHRFRELKVAFNYHVYVRDDRHHYSVPYGYRGKRVRIALTSDTVEIFFDHTRIATHRRDRTAGGYTTNRQHMPDHHREYAEWNPERFLSWARKFGEHTEVFINGELNRRKMPEQNYKSCMGILKLAQSYGSERLEAACRRAGHYNLGGYRSVKRILEKRLDEHPTEGDSEYRLPEHPNIRGRTYYSFNTGAERRSSDE